jgi:hypothetical protein
MTVEKPTENEQKIMRIILSEPHVSLRGIIQRLRLGGSKLSENSVGLIAYLINSLEEKGFVNKKGVATAKYYQLTEKAYTWLAPGVNFDSLSSQIREAAHFVGDSSVVVGSTGVDTASDTLQYLSNKFQDGSGSSDANSGINKFLSASLTKIIDDPTSWEKYGGLVLWAALLSFVVLPRCYEVLKGQWLIGFVLVALLLIIINKK